MQLSELKNDEHYTFTGFVRTGTSGEELPHEITSNNVDAHSNYYIKAYQNKIMQFKYSDGDGYHYFVTPLLKIMNTETFDTAFELHEKTGKKQEIEICFANPKHDNLHFINKEQKLQYYFKNTPLFI
jgi:hypothetical protein